MLMRSHAALSVGLLLLACSGAGGGNPSNAGGAGGEDPQETGGTGGGGRAGSGGGGTGGRGGSTGGNGGMGGSAGSGGGAADAGVARDTAAPAEDAGGGTPDASVTGDLGAGVKNFSFFLTSVKAMRRLSKSEKGFGGDLRYGEPTGLAGADKICTEVAETSMPGAGAKGWRAFLSARNDDGTEVHAIDRIGEGPWYDRNGNIVAMKKADLLAERPIGAHASIREDLPNEDGIPNHRPDPGGPLIDNHHVLTGSNGMGRLYGPNATCRGWTALTNAGRPRIGFSWTISNRRHWISGQDEGGCGAGFDLDGGGGSDPSNPIVGSGGGYGAIYCFASKP
jgi:hypothetical protein